MGFAYRTLAVDTFQRPNEDPVNPSIWAVGGSVAPNQVLNNELVPSTNTGAECLSIYSGPAVFPNNQWAQLRVDSLFYDGSYDAAILLAAQYTFGSAADAVILEVDGPMGASNQIDFYMQAHNSGTPILFIPAETVLPCYNGDYIRLEVFGTTVYAYIIHNGVSTNIGSGSVAGQGNPTPGTVAIALFPESAVTDAQVSFFSAGDINFSAVTDIALWDNITASSIAAAFTNPKNLDLLQVVDEGGGVIWSLNYQGIAFANPATPTSNALLAQFSGPSFVRAFGPNPNQLDVFQIRNSGGGLILRVDSLGYAGNS